MAEVDGALGELLHQSCSLTVKLDTVNYGLLTWVFGSCEQSLVRPAVPHLRPEKPLADLTPGLWFLCSREISSTPLTESHKPSLFQQRLSEIPNGWNCGGALSIELRVEGSNHLMFSIPKVAVPQDHFPKTTFTWNLDHNLGLKLDPSHPDERSDLILLRVEEGRLQSVRIFLPKEYVLAAHPLSKTSERTLTSSPGVRHRHDAASKNKRHNGELHPQFKAKRARSPDIDSPSQEMGRTGILDPEREEDDSPRSLLSPPLLSSLGPDDSSSDSSQILISDLDAPEHGFNGNGHVDVKLSDWTKHQQTIGKTSGVESRYGRDADSTSSDASAGQMHDVLLRAKSALDDVLPPVPETTPNPVARIREEYSRMGSSGVKGEVSSVLGSLSIAQPRQLSISDMWRDRKRKDRTSSTGETRVRLKTFRTAPPSRVRKSDKPVQPRNEASDIIAKYITIPSSSDSESDDWEDQFFSSDEDYEDIEADGKHDVVEPVSYDVEIPVPRGMLVDVDSQATQKFLRDDAEYSWAKSKHENPLPRVEKLCAAFDDPAIALQISRRIKELAGNLGDSQLVEESPVIILSSEDEEESECVICKASVANRVCPGCAPILDEPPPSLSIADLPLVRPGGPGRWDGSLGGTKTVGSVDGGEFDDAGDFFNAEEADVYSPYEVQGYENIHCAHPAHIVEGATLATAVLPLLMYEPVLPDVCTKRGNRSAISTLQLECVAYCGQRHKRMLPHGRGRAGFFIGDGTGVGKGRQCAAIIADNWGRGRDRAVWCSASAQLAKDAQRDLHDIGCRRSNRKFDIPIINLKSDVKAGLPIRQKRGLVFVTYSLLAGGKKGLLKSRLEQLVDWLDPDGNGHFDGPIIFDEGHKAKNLTRSEKTSSQTALNVIELQRLLPQARIVYVSATGASQPEDMGYMVRLGLWGEGTSFPTFQNFVDTISNAGIGAIEIVALTMKELGMYFSRHIAFTDAEFDMDEFQLSMEQIVQYNAASRLWDKILRRIQHMQGRTEVDERMKSLSKIVWGIHQRFWLEYLVALKVNACAQLAREKLELGYAVVIGLQSTGGMALEYAIERQMREKEASKQPLPKGGRYIFDNHVSTQKESILLLLRRHWDPRDEVFIAEVKKEIEMLDLPPSPLDSLVDQLGGHQEVAELTGRNKRLERLGGDDGRWVVQKRNATRENNDEKEKFMSGQKLIAVISEAASTGISLHSSVECRNQRRRYHIILQLPWSAQKAVQQLGRTHRSHQASAPHYHLLCSKLGGEWRLASAVAARLSSLGALTSGDRRGGAAVESLSQYLLEPKCGAMAAKECLKTFKHTSRPQDVDAHDLFSSQQAHLEEIERLTVLQMYSKVMVSKGAQTAKLFLNRLLGLEVELQEHLFEGFKNLYEDALMDRSRNGKVGTAVFEIEGELELGSDDDLPVVYTTPDNPSEKLHLITLRVDRGVPFGKAAGLLADMKSKPGRNSKHNGFYLSSRGLVVLALQQMRGSSRFQITKPHLGCESSPINLTSLRSRFTLIASDAVAQEMWEKKYSETDRPGRGNRIAHQFVLTGSLHLIFAKVVEIYSSRTDRKPQVVRAIWATRTGEKKRVVGLQVDRIHIVDILKDLQGEERGGIVEARNNILVLKVRERVSGFNDASDDQVLKVLSELPSEKLQVFLQDQNSSESPDSIAQFVSDYIEGGRKRYIEALNIVRSRGYDPIAFRQFANKVIYHIPREKSAAEVATHFIGMLRRHVLKQAILEQRKFCEDSYHRVPCCQDFLNSRRDDLSQVVLEYADHMRRENELQRVKLASEAGRYRRQTLGALNSTYLSGPVGGTLSGGAAVSTPNLGSYGRTPYADQSGYRAAAIAVSSPALHSLANSRGMERAQALAQPDRRPLSSSVDGSPILQASQGFCLLASAVDSIASDGCSIVPARTSPADDVIVLGDSPPFD